MTDFTETLRHRCRNPRCRSNLPSPVSNEREAFCTRGCHSSFYRKRCLICEAPMVRKNEQQLTCGKRRCRNALQARLGLGRYMAPSNVIGPPKTSIKPGIKTAHAGDIAWRIVAGPELSPSAFHCATVPDGKDCQWKDGTYERIEAHNRRALEAHFDKLDSTAVDFCTVCGRNDDLVDRKVADHWVTTCRECRANPATSANHGAAKLIASVDVVYESIGKDTLQRSLDCLRRVGMCAAYGQASGVPDPIDIVKDLGARGSLIITRPALSHYISNRSEIDAAAKSLFDDVARGIVASNVVKTFPLREAAAAHKFIGGRKTTGSIVMLPFA